MVFDGDDNASMLTGGFVFVLAMVGLPMMGELAVQGCQFEGTWA